MNAWYIIVAILKCIFEAFYAGMWAYDGWESLNYIAEEIINPPVTFPRVIWYVRITKFAKFLQIQFKITWFPEKNVIIQL